MTSTYATWSARLETAAIALMVAALPLGAFGFLANSF